MREFHQQPIKLTTSSSSHDSDEFRRWVAFVARELNATAIVTMSQEIRLKTAAIVIGKSVKTIRNELCLLNGPRPLDNPARFGEEVWYSLPELLRSIAIDEANGISMSSTLQAMREKFAVTSPKEKLS